MQYQGNIYLILSRNTEAFASVFINNIKEMFASTSRC